MPSRAGTTIIADISVMIRITVINAKPLSGRGRFTELLLGALPSKWFVTSCEALLEFIKKVQAADAYCGLQIVPEIFLAHAVATFRARRQRDIHIADVRNLRQRRTGDIGGDRGGEGARI